MNNILSYCGLVDRRISASDKDLPVQQQIPSSNKKQKAETTVAEIATAPPSSSQGYLNSPGLIGN
jgi:hypothetical protein